MIRQVAQPGLADFNLVFQIHRYPTVSRFFLSGPSRIEIAIGDMCLVQFRLSSRPNAGNLHPLAQSQIYWLGDFNHWQTHRLLI